MNKIYRIVWSTATSTWVVASEFAKGDARGSVARCMPVRRGALASIVALLLGFAHPAWAQSLFWDGTDTNANANGGNGTWNTTTTNWDTAATGGANVAWTNGLDAVFGSGGTVTIAAGGVDAHNITLGGVSYSFSGGPLTLSGTNPTISVARTNNSTINSVIAGGSGLVKSGTGGLSLGGANTYTGITRLTQGTLILANTQALGAAGNAATNFVVTPGTTIAFNANIGNSFTTTGTGTVNIGGTGGTWSGTATLGGATTLLFNGTNVRASGDLSDDGAVLSITSSGSTTLSGTNAYTGETRLTAGILTLGAMTSLPSDSNLVFDAAADAFLAIPGDFARTLGTGDDQVHWIRSGGFMSATAGTKQVDLGTDLVWGVTPNFIPTNGTLDLGATLGTLDFVNNIALPTAAEYTVHDVGNLASHAVLSGVISGDGSLLTLGNITGFANGFIELSGNNTFTGDLILGGSSNQGHVMVSSAQALPDDAGLWFRGAATSAGNTLVLTANSGNFTRALGTGANQVQWTGNGGFSAAGVNRAVNIGGGAALTWNVGSFVPTSNWLVLATAGDAEIDFQNDIDFNNAVRTVVFGTGGTSRLSGDLSNGGVTYRGGGTGVVAGNNTYVGVTTVGVNSTNTQVSVSSIGNGGQAGNLGAASNAAGNLVLSAGTINYTGAGETTDRNVTIAAGNGTLQGNGAGAIAWGGVTSQAGANTLFLSGNALSTTVNRVAGTVSNGAGTLSVDKTGTGTWALDGTNTYTGVTRVTAGVLEVSNIANGGIASSLGASSSASTNLVGNGGTLRYVGASDVNTNRAFQLANNFRIESSGTGALQWAAAADIDMAATNSTLTLGGTNNKHNGIAGALKNHLSANNVNQIRTGLTKTGTGTWWIDATNAGYTGNTTITDGTLVAATETGINGGFGATSNSTVSSGYTSTNNGSSLILFNGTGTEGGVLGLTSASMATSNGFTRSLTQVAQSFNSNATPQATDDSFTHGVRWTGSGGFAAMDGTQVVNIGGGTALSWNSNGFVPAGSSLILGAPSASGTVDFRNSISMVNGVRTIETRNGSADVDAILSGVLSAGGAGAGLVKTGAGTLALTGNNTLAGNTSVQAGTLQIGNGGTTGSIGSSAAIVSAGAVLSINRSNALTFTNLISGAGTLRQAGTGTTTFNVGRTIGGVEVLAGTLDLDAGMNTQTLLMGAGALRVGGAMHTSSGDPRITLSAVAGTASTVDVKSGALLQASGDLGDENDTLRVAGTLDSGAGLDLGAGDDDLEILDGSLITDILGGADDDAATAAITTSADVMSLRGFESLEKTGGGVLRFIGAIPSDIADIDIAAGTLSVLANASLGGPATGSVANVRANATLDIATGGAFGCGDGSDALTVSGTVSGGGTLDQCDGDDVLKLTETANIAVSAIEGGGHVAGDRLVIANAATMVVDAARVTGYELFEKQDGGALTLTGAHAYADATQNGGTVDIAGTFDSAGYTMTGATALQVRGTAGNGAGAMSIDGDTAAQSIDVEAGATVRAVGDLGAGADALDIAGALATGAGMLSLGDGDDDLFLRDGASISGLVDGDTGTDDIEAIITGNATLGRVTGFETLAKRAAGILTVDGAGVSTLDSATIHAGTLRIASGASLAAAAGASLVTDVRANATLDVLGAWGCGTQGDTWTIAGTVSGNGTKDQCGGDDTLTLTDGASISGSSILGGAQIAEDLVVVDNALALDVGNIAGYERLRKQGTGEATLIGALGFDAGIDLVGGTLAIDGTTRTGEVAMSADTTLRIDGTLEGNGGTTATITGTLGSQELIVDGLARIDANLGDSADTLTLIDGASVIGVVDGGAGIDTFDQDLAGTATMGTALGFETLRKRGVGTLVFDGATASNFEDVLVDNGTLRIASGANVTAAASRTLDTTIAANATLQVDGAYGCGTTSDTLDVAGTLSVSGTVDQCGGDDTLTLHDGGTLDGAGMIDGGAQATADRLVLDFATSRAFGANQVTGYEILAKTGAGEATLTGAQAYASRVDVQAGALSVQGALTTTDVALAANTTFTVRAGGSAEGLAGAAANVTGSAGVETIVIEDGATLFADGDLGDGDDVLDVAGALDTRGGTLQLGNGADEVHVHDTTDLRDAIIDAGAGNDLLDFTLGSGVTVALGSTAGFESLGKSGLGTMEIDGGNTFAAVRVSAGTADVSATGGLQAQQLDLFAGATLQVDGAVRGTDGNDAFTVAGTIDGAGTFDLGLGDDTLTLEDGADTSGFAAALRGGTGNDALVASIAGSATLGATNGFETLRKQGAGALMATGANALDAVMVDAGTLRVDAGGMIGGHDTTPFAATIDAGATLDLAGDFGCNAGNDTITVSGVVEGGGALQQCGGDDTLVLRDSAELASFAGAIDGGTGNDSLQLDVATARSFGGGAINYEVLRKTGAGTATLTGTLAFADQAVLDAGTLEVDGNLEAPTFTLANGTTLRIDGSASGVAGAQATMTGGTGTSTLIVDASGALRANGSLGDGADLLDLAGTLDTGAGALTLGDGGDRFTLHDDAELIGTVDGGAGIDTFETDIATNARFGAATGFEALDKTGAGALQVVGLAVSDFQSVAVTEGLLDIAGNGAISGASTTLVADGAHLRVDGAYTGSAIGDTMTIAGTVDGGGAIALSAGADTLTLHAGGSLLANVDGGADDDRVVLDATSAMSLDASRVVAFETLAKHGGAEAMLTGNASFVSTAIDAGTLRVAGALQSQSTHIADGATLQVDGTVTTGAFAPDAGAATVIVSAGGTLDAAGDLGDGTDTLELAGTLDTGGGTFSLGAGDDRFTLHDGADAGAVDGGAGADSFNTHITSSAVLGAATGFEALAKSGVGTLTVEGPSVSQFDRVSVDAGTLTIAGGGALLANGAGFATTVASGATLRVDGSFTGSAGADTMTVAGTIAGTGAIALGDGDDVLVLRDGAVLANVIDGGLPTASDSVVLDTASMLDFDATQTINFETLQKLGLGLANVLGDSSFTTVRVDAGTLAVANTLSANTFQLADATTLRIDGQAIGAIAGSAGLNTIVVAGGATFTGGGDFGAGNDVLDVAGRLDTESGAVLLGDGDDRLVVHDSTAIVGAGGIDAGAGNDTLGVDVGAGNRVPLPALTGFESLAKLGQGALQLDGASTFIDVTASEGLLHVAGNASLVAQNLVVESAGTLQLDGGFAGTAGDDVATIGGTVTGAGAFALGAGNDLLALLDGANVSALASPLDGGAGTDTLQTDIATTASLAAAIDFEGLAKTNVGTLRIDGPATTVFDTVDVQGGTLVVGATARLEGATSTTVAQGATLQVDGAFAGSAGDDLFFLAGALRGDGEVSLGAGRDTLQLADGATFADTPVDGGDGSDVVVAEIGTSATLGPIANFESLQKHGAGTLTANASQSLALTDVHAGTLAVGAGATYRSQATMVAAGATLDVAGRFVGTDGDDTFASNGIVRGSFDFAAGDDGVRFSGGPNAPLLLTGGDGNDTLTFDGMALDDGHVASLQGWERMSLEHGSALTLSTAMDGVDLLAIDATSSLFARSGASLMGSLSNDGELHVDASRMAITGGYAAGANASLFVTVSPGSNSAGGLDIAGDVTGTTQVVFASDGSTGGSTESILVIDSPDDVRGNGGFTIAGSSDNALRLAGSPFAWTFDQADDNRWYLDTDATVVMPEVAGYATLAAIGFDTTRTAQQALFGHLDSVRGSIDCAREGAHRDGTLRTERSDCSGFWISAIATETRVGAGPGFAYSGDVNGMYLGVDRTLDDREDREIRVGGYAGTARGNYWTSGASTGPIAASDANMRLEGPAYGAYAEWLWSNGSYASTSLGQQHHDAEVIANDGFRQHINGSSTGLVQQIGWKRAVEHGWSLEPQLQVGVTKQQWHDVVDASGKALTLHDDVLGHARASLRVDRAIDASNGTWRPWFAVGLEDTFGETASSVSVASVALPNEQVGQRWTFDAGLEATLHEGVTVFGAVGLANELNGTSKETRQARFGVRWNW
ncbi:autotransporter-associated beta strand repeat-containing protein [Lysobacter sp. A6]|uniref:Autotransporter-associated beta strand repeat-containing protein n=1 Tax=Noviluteimonas lactosilytica TaxID=2888523 RepID=A0ABS8JGP8_9GAMM|nr:autotransporter-associated beta strand repeat-containing protein [Lysobacter lactosilyticus]MCC8362778.1 autotransporter-associated beta strand repeat-containing protein [Lysobacter lactosilyticus]